MGPAPGYTGGSPARRAASRDGRVRNAADRDRSGDVGEASPVDYDPDPHGMPSQIYSFKHLTDVVAVSVMGGTQAARAAPAPGRSRRSLSARQYPRCSLSSLRLNLP